MPPFPLCSHRFTSQQAVSGHTRDTPNRLNHDLATHVCPNPAQWGSPGLLLLAALWQRHGGWQWQDVGQMWLKTICWNSCAEWIEGKQERLLYVENAQQKELSSLPMQLFPNVFLEGAEGSWDVLHLWNGSYWGGCLWKGNKKDGWGLNISGGLTHPSRIEAWANYKIRPITMQK